MVIVIVIVINGILRRRRGPLASTRIYGSRLVGVMGGDEGGQRGPFFFFCLNGLFVDG